MLITSQNHCMKGISNTFICSLISKDIRPTLRASQRRQYSPTHCPICNNYGLSEGRNNLSLLNPCGTWNNGNLINTLRLLLTSNTQLQFPLVTRAWRQSVTPGCAEATHHRCHCGNCNYCPLFPAQEARVRQPLKANRLTCFSFLTCCFCSWKKVKIALIAQYMVRETPTWEKRMGRATPPF